MALARGEKIVMSVPRSRCSRSCAPSRLSRSWSSVMSSETLPRDRFAEVGELGLAVLLHLGGDGRVVAVTVDDHSLPRNLAQRSG